MSSIMNSCSSPQTKLNSPDPTLNKPLNHTCGSFCKSIHEDQHSNTSPCNLKDSNNFKKNLGDFVRLNNTTLPAKTINKDNRQQIGGKGMHLEIIKNLELPVPTFTCIPINITTDIFNTQLSKNQLQQLIEHNFEFKHLSSFLYFENTIYISLFDIIKQIRALNNSENQTNCINELKALMNMPQFANLYDNSQTHEDICNICTAFSKELSDSNKEIIIRSSGQKEDDYGNSQAGSYDSIKMHINDSVMLVVMQVLASAIKEDTIIKNDFIPMSLVVQEYIDCLYGGVAFSYSSLTNNTMQVETAFGSSSAAVCGYEKLSTTVNKIALQRDENGQFQSISSIKTGELQSSTSIETHESQSLESQMQDLFSHIIALENKLQCPVDVEFCVDKNNKLWLLQVRPITHLSGAMTFNFKKTTDKSQILIQGEPCGEGLVDGYPYFADEVFQISDIPDKAIVIASQGYAYMLEDSFLNRIGGLILTHGGANTHLAIQCRQKNIPFMIITSSHYKSIDDQTLVTLCCGNIQGKNAGYLFSGKQETCIEASGAVFQLNVNAFQLNTCTKTQVFTDPGEWFKWLNNQNSHLLNYLEQNAIISKLLSPIGQTEWCMSCDRIPLFNLLESEITNFIHDMKSMVDTYQSQFNNNDNIYQEAEAVLNYIKRFEKEIHLLLKNIETGFIEGSTSLINMNENCRKLNKLLIELTIPKNINECKSMHDAIYILHKLFVNNTKNADLITNHKSKNTGVSISDYIYKNMVVLEKKYTPEQIRMCTAMAKKNEDICRHTINDFSSDCTFILEFLLSICNFYNSSTSYILNDLIIINLRLGVHECTIEMALNAENGKGIALKVQFNDKMTKTLHADGKLKRMLFVARTLQNYFGKNTFLKFNRVDNLIFMHLEKTNMANVDELLKELNIAGVTIALLVSMDIRINKKIFQGLPLDFTFEHISKIISKKPTDEENEMQELLLCYYIDGLHFGDIKQSLIDTFTKDRELVEYGLALRKSSYDKEYLPEIPEHYNVNLKSRLQKYRFLLYPIKSFKKNMVTRDILEDPQNLIMAMQSENCISEIEKAGAENMLKQIGANPDFVVECMLSQSDITPYINLSAEQMKAVIHKSVKHINSRLEFIYSLPKEIAAILDQSRYQLLTQDNNFIIFLLKNMENFLKYTNNEIKDNYEMVMAAVSSAGSCLKWASKHLQDNKEIVITAVSNRGNSLKWASESLRNNQEIVMAAISNRGDSLEWASKSLRDNQEIVMAAVSNNGCSLKWASENLRNNQDIVMTAVSNRGDSLKWASKRLRDNQNVVMTAVSKIGCSLEWASESLRDNQDIVTAAVSSFRRALEWASKRLQDNKEIVMTAVSVYGGSLEWATERWQNNEEVVNIALKTNSTYETFRHVSKRLQHDSNFLSNLKNNSRLLGSLKQLFVEYKSIYYDFFGKNKHLEALFNF